MEQKTLKKYKTTELRIKALSKINKELDDLYKLDNFDSELLESLSKLPKISNPTQHLIYANSILNYMKLLKQS